ncbi:hypothetical protein ACFZDI_04870 [Streptomyces sp. NPDC007907]|uniref:hypothetical protein n=1 Tax=Streptomyces sp. NPDC007907 TaxID=3364789 RepID=UPI0036E77668
MTQESGEETDDDLASGRRVRVNQGDGLVEVQFAPWYRQVENEWPDPDTGIDDMSVHHREAL